MTVRRPGRARPWGRWSLGATLVLVGAGITVPAVAQQTSPSAGAAAVQSDPVPGAPVPPAATPAPASSQRQGSPEVLRPPRAQAPARRPKSDREASRRTHRRVSRAQGWALLRQGAGEALDVQPLPPADADLKRVVSAYAAQVTIPRPGTGKTTGGVFVSSEPFAIPGPMRTSSDPATGHLADPSLERDGTRLTQKRGVLDVSLPSAASGTAQLSEAKVGVGLDLDDRSDAQPAQATVEVKDDVAYYGPVTPEVDLAVKATPTGFETYHQLRSDEAPESIDLPITLPKGARLRVLTEAQRQLERSDVGAVVERVEGDRTDRLVSISFPLATDDDGVSVPASFERVGEDVLRIAVPHRDRDLAYPIRVDPTFSQDYETLGASGQGATGMRVFNGAPGKFDLRGGGFLGTYGLHILANQGSGYPLYGQAAFTIPGQAQPTGPSTLSSTGGFVYQFNAYKLNYGRYPDVAFSGANEPMFAMGLLNPNGTPYEGGGGDWLSSQKYRDRGDMVVKSGAYSTQSRLSNRYFEFATNFVNGSSVASGVPGNAGTIRMIKLSTSQSGYQGYARLGWFGILASDGDSPYWASAAYDTDWKDPSEKLPVRGTDTGWGVYAFSIRDKSNGQFVETANVACSAAVWDPCPWDTEGAVGGTYSNTLAKHKTEIGLTNVPVGKRDYWGVVFDANGFMRQQDWTLRIDNDKPTLARDPQQITGGTPNAVRPDGTVASQKQIQIEAKDETSGIRAVTAKVDGQTVSVPQPTCTRDSCAKTFVVQVPADNLSTGVHKVEVTAYDQVQNASGSIAPRHQHTQTFDVTVVQEDQGPARDVEPGLGFEDWGTYDSTPTGAGSTYRVNLATGNGTWSVTPVQNPGVGINTVLRLTYNSLEPSGLLPGLLGNAGALGYGTAGKGISVQLGSITRLNEPLWIEGIGGAPITLTGNASDASRIVLTDGDGTRHSFERDRPAPGVRFKAPAGVYLELRRFRDGNAADPRFWAATRPDGTTFFFYRDGRASEVEDRHGNVLRLVYEPRSNALRPGCGYALLCQFRVKEIIDAAGNAPAGLVGVNPVTADADRKWTLAYDDQDRLTEIRDRKRIDGQRRVTRLSYTGTQLTSIVVGDNAGNPNKRQWQLGWDGTSGFLSSVRDPRSSTTKITYTDPQPTPMSAPVPRSSTARSRSRSGRLPRTVDSKVRSWSTRSAR